MLMTLMAGNSLAAADAAGKIDIPFAKFVLDNGLTLIVHEDHKAPIVAFNVWYHVGSKNEKPGRTGFAHLFEHLMFNGSENYDDDYFKPMQKVGATDLNGTTNEDRTNYFENVPTPAFDLALWLESDRMGHLKGAITQGKLDEQRGVVQNEKRQYDNEPYSVAEELIARACFPAGHPYSWTVIGSMEDLSAAKLDDVHQWFANYYGPNNAVIAIAGDIDAQTALAKVKQFFGDIPPGPPIARHEAWVAKRSGEQRQKVEDRVPQARIMKIWNVPQAFTAENDRLALVAQLLGSGKTSRLYKRLIYDDQIATDLAVYLDNREIAGLFTIQADVKSGVETAVVEKAIDEELKRFLADGPAPRELEKVRMQYLARFIRGSERIGGFGGKSDILARSQVFGNSPDAYRRTLENVAAATPALLKETAGQWLSDGVYTLEITPYPERMAGKDSVDRSKLPEPGPAPAVQFPEFQRFTLGNGLKVIL
ncbi:MAG: pitrilysin family protein, partial [Acidobacteriota bacterium]|nr:pitrilysin family protein [Acidobacteriota bacterium]